jgi:hypothetical protein
VLFATASAGRSITFGLRLSVKQSGYLGSKICLG